MSVALLCCGIALGQGGSVGTDPGSTGDSPPDGGVVKGHSLFQTLISLDDQQRAKIRDINYALEDILFPLGLEVLTKEWEIRRIFREEPPNQAAIMMLSSDFERLEEQFQGAITEHRKMARDVLNEQQLVVLGLLERVLELQPATEEAINLNLIAGPPSWEDIWIFPESTVPSVEGVSLNTDLVRRIVSHWSGAGNDRQGR